MLKRLFATFGIAALLSACGTPPPVSNGQREAVDLISLAADTMRDAGSMSFTMDMSMSGEGFSTDTSAEGAMDMTARRGHMEMQIPGPPGAAPGADRLEMRIIDNNMYLQMPSSDAFQNPAGKSWMRIDMGEAGGSFGDPFSSSDPTAWADYLRGISDDVETVGREEIRGHMTTHYKADVSLEEALEQLPAEQRDRVGTQLETFKDQFGLNTMPVEVWIDDDGLIWRQSSSFDFGQGSMTMSLDILEYGVEVEVEKPPEDEIFESDWFGSSGFGSSSVPAP